MTRPSTRAQWYIYWVHLARHLPKLRTLMLTRLRERNDGRWAAQLAGLAGLETLLLHDTAAPTLPGGRYLDRLSALPKLRKLKFLVPYDSAANANAMLTLQRRLPAVEIGCEVTTEREAVSHPVLWKNSDTDKAVVYGM